MLDCNLYLLRNILRVITNKIQQLKNYFWRTSLFDLNALIHNLIDNIIFSKIMMNIIMYCKISSIVLIEKRKIKKLKTRKKIEYNNSGIETILFIILLFINNNNAIHIKIIPTGINFNPLK